MVPIGICCEFLNVVYNEGNSPRHRMAPHVIGDVYGERVGRRDHEHMTFAATQQGLPGCMKQM
jgi:hypothetical protein